MHINVIRKFVLQYYYSHCVQICKGLISPILPIFSFMLFLFSLLERVINLGTSKH